LEAVPRPCEGDQDFIVGAARIASKVAATPGDTLNESDIRHAEWWLSRAEEPLTGEQLDTHTGGELSPLPASSSGAPMASVELRNTVQNADLVNADASRERLELAHAAGALETGLDAAETIRAANSLEKMLAHQMAAMHGSTMKMVAQLNACIGRMHSAWRDGKGRPLRLPALWLWKGTVRTTRAVLACSHSRSRPNQQPALEPEGVLSALPHAARPA
jgi:hypothetical protein